MTEKGPLLDIQDVETGYGKKQVLFGVSMTVAPGEIVGVIGPNGAGKSTVLKAVCGVLPVWDGEIRFRGELLDGSTPAQNVARGITFAPQGNRVFDELTVMENLEIGGMMLAPKEMRDRIDGAIEMFPILGERLRQDAGKLSGGEQQMLAIARALVARPRLLLLDEPSLGLSPGLVRDLFAKIVDVNRQSGVAVLIVEQKVREALAICHRAYALKLGEVAFEGSPDELKGDRDKLRQLFL